jgi:hypothetical protein
VGPANDAGPAPDDFTVHHPRGVATGHDQLVAFYEAYYPLTVGMRRQHLNHVVTGNEDGTITVLSYNLLVRVATPERAADLKGQPVIEAESGLPAIAMHSLTIDRFRRDPGYGWRFAERRVEETVVSAAYR